jgi:signal transduction histidine kinase
MMGMLGTAEAAAQALARPAGRGLLQVLTAPDPPPAWWRSPPRRRAAIVLTVLGLVLIGMAALGMVLACFRAGVQAELLLVPGLLAPLPFALRYPLLGWRIAYLTAVAVPLVPGQPKWDPAQIAVLLLVFWAAGLRHPRPVLWWMWALMLAPVWLWTGPGWVKPAQATVLFTVAAVLVDGAGAWLRARRALASQVEQAEIERSRRAVLEERARIARELHDVVAHHLSLIAVQTETAPYRLSGGMTDPVRAEFCSLSGAAREALTEMRKLLGVLRSDYPADRAPQPRLADVPELAAAARRAGGTVRLSMPATADNVPPDVGVCAYRIVQEALSNAGRHAPGAAVTVTVDNDINAIRLQIANSPGTPAAPSPNGYRPGHGLTGMRERVALLGGSLTAGPARGGGFAVSAVLPLPKTP